MALLHAHADRAHRDHVVRPLYGDDHLAGGAGDDTLLGQLGDDTIQGDGALALTLVDGRLTFADHGRRLARRSWAIGGELHVRPSFDAATDGDDYVEGGGGADAIFGNLGQDDLIGGSSGLFGLTDKTMRPDASDLVFGGSGTATARNEAGVVDSTHARDADTIVGDNGEIYRLVAAGGTTPLGFTYDDTFGQQLAVRSVRLLDYTPGGPDVVASSATTDIRGDDEVHGESGDDTVYLGAGDDIAYGDAGDDDIVGGWGHDWISGGTGQDGVLGDDGRIFTFRNGQTEPLHGITTATAQGTISTPGNIQTATTYATGQLNKYVDLTPFAVANNGLEPLARAYYANDVIFGGLGSDFLHGGFGEDAISGAEALEESYAPTYAVIEGALAADGRVRTDWSRPFNVGGGLLGFDVAAGEFVLYDEYNAMRRIMLAQVSDGVGGFRTVATDGVTGQDWFLNNRHDEGVCTSGSGTCTVWSDGDDVIFGDNGNDWLVGGTGKDTLWGGWGNDLLNADDKLDSGTGAESFQNKVPDTHTSYEDRAYGGAGIDVLIGNTGGDRLIDWVGEFNSFLVPFAPFGLATVSRTVQPGMYEFLYALSRAQGADRTLGSTTDPRNGEPFGEIGVVTQKDDAWQEQTGGPRDPQAGNVPGGQRDVLRGADFNTTTSARRLLRRQRRVGGQRRRALGRPPRAWARTPPRSSTSTSTCRSTTRSRRRCSRASRTAGWNANAYIIFDYFSPTDFKYAGIDISTNKLVMGVPRRRRLARDGADPEA